MDKATFLEDLAEELDKRLPAPHDGRKSDLRLKALNAELPYETLAGYVAGKNEPSILNWRKLCQIFPGLDEAIFGNSSEAEKKLTAIMRDFKALLAKHGNGNGATVKVPKEGRAS